MHEGQFIEDVTHAPVPATMDPWQPGVSNSVVATTASVTGDVMTTPTTPMVLSVTTQNYMNNVTASTLIVPDVKTENRDSNVNGTFLHGKCFCPITSRLTQLEENTPIHYTPGYLCWLITMIATFLGT